MQAFRVKAALLSATPLPAAPLLALLAAACGGTVTEPRAQHVAPAEPQATRSAKLGRSAAHVPSRATSEHRSAVGHVAVEERALEPTWCFDAGAAIAGVTSKPTGGGYVTTYEGHLHALGPSGRYLWSYTLEGQASGRPAATQDRVLVATSGGRLYAVAPSGSLVWVARLPSRPTTGLSVDDAGTVYFAGVDRRLYAVSRWGTMLYSVALGGGAATEPAVLGRGELAVLLEDGETVRVHGAKSVSRQPDSAARPRGASFHVLPNGTLSEAQGDASEGSISERAGTILAASGTRVCSYVSR